MKKERKHLKTAFLQKKINMKKTAEEYLVSNGTIQLAWKVSSIDDVINPHSVPGYEFITDELASYLESFTKILPKDMPVVLQISGCKFTEKEQQLIRKAIDNYFVLEMMKIQNAGRGNLLKVLWFAVFFILTVLAFLFSDIKQHQMRLEIFYVIFYFFGDRLIDYFFLEGHSNLTLRRQLAQLSCMDLYFTVEYDDDEWTDDEALEAIKHAEKMAYKNTLN